MRRWLTIAVGTLALLWAQTMLLPSLLPPLWRPDLLLIATALIGFVAPDGRAFLVGALCGGLQGWLHGSAFAAFVLSRAIAGGFAGWLRSHWLWVSAPAAAFCVGASVLLGELCQGALLCLAERSLAPLISNGAVIGMETLMGVLLGGLLFWWRYGKEAWA
ncbi:MAG: hypothetical protein RRB24_03590 [Armatimonadota bacterium]|jgi:hypothetical protein|nr:hypothetical protein [Armatimonadota bacterium]MDT7971890.1 hypothetical protein [Armatimonadota bacterium]